jgi:hypothetical protein
MDWARHGHKVGCSTCQETDFFFTYFEIDILWRRDLGRIGLKLLSQKLFTVLSNLEEISIPPPKKFPIQCTPRALNIYFGPSLADWYDTTAIWTTLSPIAMDHDEWDQIVFPGNLMVHSNTADV